MSVQVNPNRQNSGSALSNAFSMFNTAKDLGNQFKAKPEGASAQGPDFSTGSDDGLGAMSKRMGQMKSGPDSQYFQQPNPYSSDGILKAPGDSASAYSVDGAGKAAAMDGEFGSAADAATVGGAADAAGGSDAIFALA